MSLKELQTKLDENIPRDVISSRSGGGNKQLSYLETWYVIDRLNQVLGSNGWSNEIKSLSLLPGEGRPTYMAITRLVAYIDDGHEVRSIVKEGVGYGSDKSDHNAHELAMKEAVSDSFKVAAKNLGRSLGLALYDKTQEFVGESKDAAPTVPPKVVTKSAAIDPRIVIKSAANVLIAKRKTTKEDFQAKYLNGKASKDLNDVEAKTALAALSQDFPELNLNA